MEGRARRINSSSFLRELHVHARSSPAIRRGAAAHATHDRFCRCPTGSGRVGVHRGAGRRRCRDAHSHHHRSWRSIGTDARPDRGHARLRGRADCRAATGARDTRSRDPARHGAHRARRQPAVVPRPHRLLQPDRRQEPEPCVSGQAGRHSLRTDCACDHNSDHRARRLSGGHPLRRRQRIAPAVHLLEPVAAGRSRGLHRARDGARLGQRPHRRGYGAAAESAGFGLHPEHRADPGQARAHDRGRLSGDRRRGHGAAQCRRCVPAAALFPNAAGRRRASPAAAVFRAHRSVAKSGGWRLATTTAWFLCCERGRARRP